MPEFSKLVYKNNILIMHSKYTNSEPYDWMISQISSSYFQAYQLAFDMAKQAEKTYQYEIGQYNTKLVNFGHWDSLKKGLLAGEKLYLGLKRLDIVYLEQNKREYDITKNISLAKVNPLALMSLKENGTCLLDLSEILFDMDYPGHYMRRIKSAGISTPCIVGPYTSINCTVTLLKNSIRTSSQVGNQYQRDTTIDDSRFTDNLSAVQSIATSHSLNDKGMFELNFRDERYLPFEESGLISEWRIDLPKEFNYFDFNTISDVIMHIRYTSRDGGQMLKNTASQTVFESLPSSGLQLFDVKGIFPTEWYKFIHAGENNDQELTITIDNKYFPFYTQNKNIEVKSIELLAQIDKDAEYDVIISPPLSSTNLLNLTRDGQFGTLHRLIHGASPGANYPIGEWRIKIKRQGLTDFTSLQANEIQRMFMIVQFQLVE